MLKLPVERYRFIFYPSFSEKLFYKGRKGEYKGKENSNGGFSEQVIKEVGKYRHLFLHSYLIY